MSSPDQRHWDAKVNEIERLLNTAVNKTTSKTTFEALHGYQPRYHGGELLKYSLTKNNWVNPDRQQQMVRETVVAQQQYMKEAYDQRHYTGVKYVGEVVVMLRQPSADQSTKLQSKYRERPLQVIEVLPSDTYRMAELTADDRQVYSTTSHIFQFKSWKILRNDDEDQLSGEEDEDYFSEETKQLSAAKHPVEDKKIPPKRIPKTPGYLKDYQL
jgi:hypothetical protein